MMVGRFIYGVGGSGQFIALLVLLVKYTSHKRLTLF